MSNNERVQWLIPDGPVMACVDQWYRDVIDQMNAEYDLDVQARIIKREDADDAQE